MKAINWIVAAASLLATGAKADPQIDFQRMVLPLLEARCFECHRSTHKNTRGRTRRPKGGLALDGRRGFLKGSAEGPVIAAGDPKSSSLYSRTILAPDDPDVMPAKGDPLTPNETEILRRWIEQGADFGQWTGYDGGDSKDREQADRDKNTIPERIRFLTTLGSDLPPPDPKALDAARRANARVTPAFPDSPLLRIEFISRENTVRDSNVAALLPLKDHITQLNLAKTRISNAALTSIGAMTRLTKLSLHQTAITDEGLSQLIGLTALRSLNLYGTSVSDEGLEAIGKLRKLRAVYLWKTRVTEAGVVKLKSKLPTTKISHIPELPEVEEMPADNNNRRRKGR